MKDIAAFASNVVEETLLINGHTESDWVTLKEVAEVTTQWIPELAQIYSDMVRAGKQTGPLVEHLNPADHRQGFAVWLETLVSGAPGEMFWAETCIIGLGHASGNVNNRHVLAMASRLEEEFIHRSAQAFDAEQAVQVILAFKRVFGLAQSVMVDSYLHALMRGMEGIGINERLVARIRKVAIRRMIDEARGVLPLIDWTDSLSVGIESIDEQHKKLVGYLNALHEGSSQGTSESTLKEILGNLVTYTVEHFAFEEQLFEEHDYPGAAEHKEAHVSLTKQVGAFNEQFQAGEAKLSGDLFKFLRSWLNGHIRGTDKLYSAYMTARGVK